MLAALGAVITASLSGVMMPGPMFTVTLAKSLKSPWAGVMVSFGHAVIEVPLILLIYFGLKGFFQNNIFQLVLSVLGGGMIIWMSYDLFRSRNKIVREGKDTSYNAFVAGILMSGLNPFFLFWWATAGLAILQKFFESVGVWGLPFFILVHWACDLIWLSLISYSIFKTHKFWGQKLQELIFILLSILLVYFGIQFVIQGIDRYIETNAWNWIHYVLWGLGGVSIIYLVINYLRNKEKNSDTTLVN
jgi:threonine/homoserine/homoserine lactone efflux protein